MVKLLISLVIFYSTLLNAQNTQVIEFIVKAADLVQVPRELLLALCWTESSYRTNLPLKMDGASPSIGICQVKEGTALYVDKVYHHKRPATINKLQNPYINALYAAKYLKLQMRRYGGNWQLALDGYNRGYAKSQQSQYVKRVLAHMASRPWHN
jgi:soluble lytic murein transglycosylase-like protein